MVTKQFGFSRREIIHLVAAGLLVVGVGLTIPTISYNDYSTLALLAATFTMSFLIHEIAHKVMAQRNGLWAEFRLNSTGTILTLLSMISSYLKIIGPGAVIVSGSADERTVGKISIVGPTSNIVLATIFYAMVPLWMHNRIFPIVAFYNAWMAIFNLVPLGMLDGYKVFKWNKRVWTLAFAGSVALVAVTFLIL